jgi:hypothetical protein
MPSLNEAGDDDREYACVHIDSEGINLSVLESEEYGGASWSWRGELGNSENRAVS